MCNKIVLDNDYIVYLRKQRDKYNNLYIDELCKGNFSQYLHYFSKLYSTLVVQYENIIHYFGDLRFYINCLRINERKSNRFKKLYRLFKGYSFSYLLDILNNKRYELLKEIMYATNEC